MEKEAISDLLKYGERITLECKKAENNLPKSVWETYSSFANTNGGTILFGIEENMKAEDFENHLDVYKRQVLHRGCPVPSDRWQ